MDISTSDLDRNLTIKAAVAAILIIIVGGAAAVDSLMVEKQVNSFNPKATVIPPEENQTSLGLVADRNLNFGKVPAGAAVRKEITVGASEGSVVKVLLDGNISEHLNYQKNRLDGEHRIQLEFNASEPGYYEGNLRIKTQSPKNGLGRTWLDLKQ